MGSRLSFSFLLFWCCLRRPLVYHAVSALSSVVGLVRCCSPWWPKLGTWRRQLAPCKDSSGLPAWVGAVGLCIFSGQIRKGRGWLLGRRGRAPASSCMAGVLLWPRVLAPEGTGCGPGGAPSPGPSRDGVAKPFGSCRSLVAPGAQTRRQVLSLSLNATKSLLVGAKLLVST